MLIKNKPYRKLFILALVIVLSISCGIFSDSETEEKDSNTITVITATVQETPTISTGNLQPESPPLKFVQYDHSSGAFSVMIPEGIVSDERDFSVYFRITDTADFVIGYNNAFGSDPTTQDLSDYSQSWIDNTMLETNYAESCEITDTENIDNIYTTHYTFTHNSGKEGFGSLTLIRTAGVVYVLDFTSFNFDEDDPIREEIVNTLSLYPSAATEQLIDAIEMEFEDWRLSPYPDSQFIVNEKEATPDSEEIVDYHATALSISKPYFWDIYSLPDGTRYDEIKDHFRSVMQERNYQQAMDKQWDKETYTLTYLHSVNKSAKNAVIFMGEYGERKPMLIILYSNPQ